MGAAKTRERFLVFSVQRFGRVSVKKFKSTLYSFYSGLCND